MSERREANFGEELFGDIGTKLDNLGENVFGWMSGLGWGVSGCTIEGVYDREGFAVGMLTCSFVPEYFVLRDVKCCPSYSSTFVRLRETFAIFGG